MEQLGFAHAGSKVGPTETAGADNCFFDWFDSHLGQEISES